MNLTDFYFLCFFALILLIYYIVPGKKQWVVLLLSSIAYYLFAGNGILILYPVLSICLCYACSLLIERADNLKHLLRKRIALYVGVILLLSVLILLKYLRFSSVAELLIPLGLSYYTFTLIGYIVDVYNGIACPQKNIFKLLAFGLYFPTLVSGPILKYRELEENFFEKHPFDYKEFTYGLQRMLWGFFKKLVIAERLGIIVSTVYDDPSTYGGAYVWLAILAFTFQLYTDFSGLMDIVLGISECVGIKLPENFNTPFFSKSISEYWRRWHITLGVWFKEYVFYPVLRIPAWGKMQKKLRDKFGKKAGKQLSTFMAMFILWTVVGLWHGGNVTYLIGSGLLHWFYIVMEELLEPPFNKLWNRLGVDIHAKWLEGTRIVRTFILVNIGNAFFRSASLSGAINLFRCGFGIHTFSSFINGGIFELGLDWIEFTVAVFSLLILLTVSIIKQKGSVRDQIAAKPIVVRFLIWYALLFYVILLGNYGPGYSAAEFIYQGF